MIVGERVWDEESGSVGTIVRLVHETEADGGALCAVVLQYSKDPSDTCERAVDELRDESDLCSDLQEMERVLELVRMEPYAIGDSVETVNQQHARERRSNPYASTWRAS